MTCGLRSGRSLDRLPVVFEVGFVLVDELRWLRSWRDRLKRRKVRWSNGGRGDFCEVGNLVAKLKILTNVKKCLLQLTMYTF